MEVYGIVELERMEVGVPSAKKSRHAIAAPAPPPPQSVGLSKPKQQLPMIQPFHFQPPPQERKRPATPIYHFYQQQIQQQQQRMPSPAPAPRRIKRVEEFPDNERDAAAVNPPWAPPTPMALPVSLTMPLHAVSPTGYAAAAAAAAAMASSTPPGSGPVRRVGSKRAAPSPPVEDWRFANGMAGSGGGGSMSFMSSPPPPPPPSGGFLVSPASFAGPVNVSVAGGSSQRMPVASVRSRPLPATDINPARAAAIEKRRAKLKQVSAAYHMEMQSQCQKLLLLQRECRESDSATAREVSSNYVAV